MKLYLSSYRLGNVPQQLTDLIGNNKKITVIPNALDFSIDIPRRNDGVQREIDDLKKIGLKPEEVDLRNYFGKEEDLRVKMSGFGSV